MTSIYHREYITACGERGFAIADPFYIFIINLHLQIFRFNILFLNHGDYGVEVTQQVVALLSGVQFPLVSQSFWFVI